MPFPAAARKLHDCQQHGLGSELFIVEGDSASSSVVQVLKSEFQAVLPMQGKPLNPLRSGAQRVRTNRLYAALIEALGAGWAANFSAKQLRYERIFLLMDPDPDGMHCSFLLQMFFYRWMRPLVDQGRIHTVWAPMGEIHVEGNAQPHYAYTEPHLVSLRRRLVSEGAVIRDTIRHRGLASLGASLLAATCVAPATRTSAVVTSGDVAKVIETFAPEESSKDENQLDLF